ncbi:MAG: hypothetical protein ACREBR_05045 [bacterium]
MKIKGLKSQVSQVTFIGNKHPTNGVVSTFTWEKLAYHLQKVNESCVESIKIDEHGLTVYWNDGHLLGMEPKL